MDVEKYQWHISKEDFYIFDIKFNKGDIFALKRDNIGYLLYHNGEFKNIHMIHIFVLGGHDTENITQSYIRDYKINNLL